MNVTDLDRRARVHQLLRQATDLKLMTAQTADALSLASEARALAFMAPRLHEPWPQITAYRRGHLLMRLNRDEDLDQARDDFEDATRGNILGPLPQLYLLAVLHRLRRRGARGSDVRQLDQDIAETFTEATQLTRETAFLDASADSDPDARARLQDNAANLLELAAYFLGQDLRPLEGLRDPYSDLRAGPAWCLVGRDPRLADVRYTRSLALAELQALGDSRPRSVLFRWPAPPGLPEWRLSTGADLWQGISHEQARLLTALLTRADGSRLVFVYAAVGEDPGGDPGRDARYRKILERTRKALGILTGRSGASVIVAESIGLPPKLPKDLEVFGAVDLSNLLLLDTP